MSSTARRCAEFLACSYPEGGKWSEADIQAILDRPGGEVFEIEGGFAIVSTVHDEAEIWTIAINPKLRRRGLGRALLQKVLTGLRQKSVNSVFLEVAADNTAAQALYLDMGFAEVSRRHGYYRGPERHQPVDAVVMVKKLHEKM